MSNSLHSRIKTKTYPKKLMLTHKHPQNTGPRKILKGIKSLPEGNKLPERIEENETKKFLWQLRIRANYFQGENLQILCPMIFKYSLCKQTYVLSYIYFFCSKGKFSWLSVSLIMFVCLHVCACVHTHAPKGHIYLIPRYAR